MNIACPLKILNKKKTPTKNIWNNKSQTLRLLYLDALKKELLTGHLKDKEETARRKKQYDLKLKTLRKQRNSDFIEQSDNKQKAIWNVINNERKEKLTNNSVEHLKIEEDIADSPVTIANYLNNFFATMADRTLLKNGTSTLPTESNNILKIPNLTFFEIDENEKNIYSFKPKTSAREDEVSAKLIKQCKHKILHRLK